MFWHIIHIVDLLLWLFLAGSVAYVVLFAFFSLLRKSAPYSRTSHLESALVPRTSHLAPRTQHLAPRTFLVVYPAYREDIVIRQSVETFLKQDYSPEHYRLIVVSDQMQPETNAWLAQQPLTLLQPTFQKSSKAKALQFALNEVKEPFDYIVILDADNVVAPDFLSRLNDLCQQGYQAIQCHRTAKNSNTDIAALDGISEEINNTLFRRAHNNVGLSSALIGSGMCFVYEWFRSHVGLLQTAVEDRELEALLLEERIYVHYEESLLVMDEKVSSQDNFQRQRLRWMTGQVQSLFQMMPRIPHAVATGNIGYIDKTIQQALIPRSILLLLLPLMALLMTLLSWPWSIKWWVLLFCFALALFIAIPPQLRSRALFGKALALPALAWRMFSNLFRIDKSNTDFIHTSHDAQ